MVKTTISAKVKNSKLFEVQSIDTMKYSRDLALESKNDPHFQNIINLQVKDIAETGATHIAIGTPYDEEFYSTLKSWVTAARNNNLKVWFRGNFSGWEGWFGYPRITREDHLAKTREFIRLHSDLFKNGDIFTPCPECENGGPGDPRNTHDVEGHRKFLIDEYKTTKEEFEKLNKKVKSNFNSMNGDVASLVMDRKTTHSLDGIVVIDHYVKSPQTLLDDIDNLAKKTGGKVVLGEFGAPIPDIHGQMTEVEQENYLNEVFNLLVKSNNLIGINYWVNVGGSTELWDKEGNPKKALNSLKSLYKPKNFNFFVENEVDEPIANAKFFFGNKIFGANSNGKIIIPFFNPFSVLKVEAKGYKETKIYLKENQIDNNIVLKKENENLIFKSEKFINNIFPFLSK